MAENTITLQLPDGTELQVERGTTFFDVAKSISPRLAKEALAGELDGKVMDLNAAIPHGGAVRILTFNDEKGREVYWHSSSHLMAHAIMELFPEAKFGVGPAIEEGFYYDVDIDKVLTPDDLVKIEEKIAELVKEGSSFVRKELSKNDALEFFKQKNDPYKVELISEMEEDKEAISCYTEGSFVDLCRGPHVPSTSLLKNFKLLSISGSYWRGDSDRKQLQRIYGISFPKKKMLDEFLFRVEEAKKRDHRKLGRELDLFSFHEISPGAPFWHPRGMMLVRILEEALRKELDAAGYQEISTPILVKKELWEQSGHWEHYQENMFFVEADNDVYSLKPMNCPESTYIYRAHVRSYRDLPLRYSEIGRLHRNELSGALNGMFRVRQITMDDAHLFVRPDQILDEITGILKLVNKFYGYFEFSPSFVLSTRPEKAMGDPALWRQAEKALEDALIANGIGYKIEEGEGAFYGPKIDIIIKDALGRKWQLATIQLDFQMPERFGLEYVDENNERRRPVMIHRAIFGSFERFIGILVEHFAGNFPVWLAPVQVAVLPISENFSDYAFHVATRLKEEGIRTELDARNEKIGYKIRAWEIQKVPYMCIIGEKEVASNTVSIRRHQEGDIGASSLSDYIARVKEEVLSKKL